MVTIFVVLATVMQQILAAGQAKLHARRQISRTLLARVTQIRTFLVAADVIAFQQAQT